MKRQDISFRRIMIFVFPLITVFNSCQKENAVPREYPRIKDTGVINVSDSGATFSADLYSLGTESLIEYGFVWGFFQGLDISKDNRMDLGVPGKAGIFTAEVKSALKDGTTYYVRPFVITDTRIVYGPAASFKNLGSLALIITGIEPSTAGSGDTIEIE
jgi:hypothetical protein